LGRHAANCCVASAAQYGTVPLRQSGAVALAAATCTFSSDSPHFRSAIQPPKIDERCGTAFA
jgi:hypothetical protein